MSEPDSLKWTLRFKNHNVTILLLVSPAQSFESIKEELLKALKVRNIAEINGQPVPEEPDEIEFGIPLDRNNLEKGWEMLRPATEEAGNEKKKQPLRGRKTVVISPEGAGLKDSQALAFRFRKPVEGENEDELGIGFDDPGWDVKIATYDAEDDE
ncbi:hypothetical protein AJ78_07161 [Emergomyces pasteurianus Ep9510]|uniref:Uncharacterized protein n=1 Tax=Emergomyces pasteurianus Ep9510 TaxID=1447872 RepID=A0A1J9P8G2_9EURO|nr:hypothetical protein AJ78_07161 [Emergomyces pasteurianus Ep9510]